MAQEVTWDQVYKICMAFICQEMLCNSFPTGHIQRRLSSTAKRQT